MSVLRELAAALGQTCTPDDVARVALTVAPQIPGVLRAGMAVSQGAGRQLRFAASDGDALADGHVRWCQIDGLADVPLAKTTRNGVGVYLGSLDELFARYPQIAEKQRALGTRALATLPLGVSDEKLGGMLLSFDSERDFDPGERAYLEAFTAQISQALRRGIDRAAEPSTAERLQRSLMAQTLPDLDGLSLGAHYHSGDLGGAVGGDWYDVVSLPAGVVLVVVGDVMGKGPSAAVTMGQVRSATRAYALLDPSPSVVLERLDLLVRSIDPADQIVTMAVGAVDADRRTLRVALAGHPPPLLVRSAGEPWVLGGEQGPALGLGVGPWPEQTVVLDDELTVLFHSNGLVETRDVDYATGVRRLCADVRHAEPGERAPRALCGLLGDLAWGRASEDDVAMLAVSRSRRRRLYAAAEDLPADASASPLARRFVNSRLAEWGVDEELVETAQLCVSELVTNAVIHSGTPSRVTVRLDDERLLVAVKDGGSRGAIRQAAEEEEPMLSSGRGLTIVDHFAKSWSAERSVDGTTVWFELDLGGVADSA